MSKTSYAIQVIIEHGNALISAHASGTDKCRVMLFAETSINWAGFQTEWGLGEVVPKWAFPERNLGHVCDPVSMVNLVVEQKVLRQGDHADITVTLDFTAGMGRWQQELTDNAQEQVLKRLGLQGVSPKLPEKAVMVPESVLELIWVDISAFDLYSVTATGKPQLMMESDAKHILTKLISDFKALGIEA